MDTSTSHLLVPVDYSDKAVYGLQMAAKVLKKYGGKVTVIHVLKGVDAIWSDFFSDEERDDLLKKLKAHLQHFTNKYISPDAFEIDYEIGKGRLCDTILETAEKLKVTTIIMGTSTVDNIKKRIIGTNALRVVSEARCPVITLKSEPEFDEIKQIVLPLDITKETREKTVETVHLAKIFKARIHVVSAYTINDESIIGRLERQMEQVEKYIKKHQIECTTQILKVKDRVDAVLEVIREKNAELVVLTTHQQLEIVESFLGSFAKSMIKEARIPVMSIVPKIKHHVVFKLPAS
jgi:nucleotide-binding universal stress UspA family protein